MVTRCVGVCTQAAARTNDTAGDGTTTATILSAAIIAEGMKIVAAGANPVQLTRGIERTVAKLVEKLQESSTEVTDEGLADVATVSAGNNRVVSPGAVFITGSAAQVPQARHILGDDLADGRTMLWFSLGIVFWKAVHTELHPEGAQSKRGGRQLVI